MRTKRCPCCGLEKPIDQFHPAPNRAGGVTGYCKPCHNFRGRVSKGQASGPCDHMPGVQDVTDRRDKILAYMGSCDEVYTDVLRDLAGGRNQWEVDRDFLIAHKRIELVRRGVYRIKKTPIVPPCKFCGEVKPLEDGKYCKACLRFMTNGMYRANGEA